MTSAEENYKDFAISLAKKAGKIIRANFVLAMQKEWKSDHTPVTQADFKINKLVINAVRTNFPGHSILAEEASDMRNGKNWVWVCDPIDGTVPFSHGIPICAFSLALVHNGQPVLGVIYDPFMDRLFSAEIGRGAFLNGKPIHVNSGGIDNSAVVGWSYNDDTFRKIPQKVKVLNLYSTVYGGMLVAAGELVASYYSLTFAHDAAAQKVLVEEAGGRVTDRNGQEQRYDGPVNGALISNGVVHDELIALLKKSSAGT